MIRFLAIVSTVALSAAAANFSDGMKAFGKKDYEAAQRSLTEIIKAKERCPLFDDALYWRARCHEEQDNGGEAKKDYLRLLRECEESEYAEDALKRFIDAGGNRADVIDCSTPEKMWKAFCKAAVQGNLDGVLSCLGGEMRKDIQEVLKTDRDDFIREIASEVTKAKIVKVVKVGDDKALLTISVDDNGKDKKHVLGLEKMESGWMIVDPEVDKPEAPRHGEPPPPLPPVKVDWPEMELTEEQKKEFDSISKKLGSDSFLEREEATEQILKMGPAVGREVKKLLGHEDPEVRFRARKILEELAKAAMPRP